MAKRNTIKTVDKSFHDKMDKDIPFGGKIMVLGGDFRQVLPVVPKSTRAEMVNASLVRSYLWPLMEKIQLSTNMRARTDQSFSDFLLCIRNGEKSMIKDNLIALPKQMIVQQSGILILKNHWFGKYFRHSNKITRLQNKLNAVMIEKFAGETKTYISFDTAKDDNNNYYQEEYLNTLTPNGLPPHRLSLKENAPIMLLRNLDPSNGLCNRTRLICKGFDKNVKTSKKW
ncbi:hypothetical protein H5410_045100 [Solanum commersonii]|uniref:ATP-dependent DNA helicase n=1 Tax=Solanum commersonii TaxID=4109 RepID=A0A9J5XA31_SOLCO|nr:hypothetical protein H5410_045100 [Solanum commersonii]